MAYAFEPILLIDAANPTHRAASASATVYDANDTGNTTPLALTDLNGIALTNPLTSTADAFTPAFLSPSSQVKIVGGGLTVVAWSGQGLLDQATQAKQWVQGITVGSATAGTTAAANIDSNGVFSFTLPQGPKGTDGSNVLPTDTAIAQAVNDSTTSTAAAIRSKAAAIWQPNTAYAAGQPVIDPSGNLVTANAAHTSGTSFTAANWSPPSGRRVTSAQPQVANSQAPAGYAVVGVFGNTLLAVSQWGLVKSDDAGATWAGKSLPSDVPTNAQNSGANWVVLFKGNYYLQSLKTSDGLPGIFRAAPVTGTADFSWSGSLLNGSAGSKIITTALAADDQYIYFGEYGDPTAGPSVWRSADGTTWTKVLGPGGFAARHVHGIFPDPYNPGTVYLTCGDAGSSGYIYRSTDYGATWAVLPGFGTNQAWQSVQVSFDQNWLYFGPDTTSNFSAFRVDRATLTPRWMARQTHRYLPVPTGLPSRKVTDLATTSGSATVTSATANFTSADVGSRIRTTGQNVVPIDSYIASVTNATTAVLSSKATVTGTGYTAIFGGETWGAMSYYGAIDPSTGIYYFASINGAAGGNVDGLFCILPDGTITLLDILTTSPDGRIVIDATNKRVYASRFWRPLLAL